ncbi:hypothetical protein [Meiothermus sp. CFH 77666]|uniref:hypothetical protein n=1 Tax=Meiothermus sp. CFH 77666 TaxID=2817942 RepID=UPI001AA0A69F|nr:hypothetical protein [Meiothermus sp. CFH 77666]MBO1436574.1 hypothetical protein [Meiothermus sp. CFH 77666]
MKRFWQSPYRGSLLTVLVGLALLLVARELPPDLSLAQVRQAGVVKVCHPPNLPPLIERGGRGQEAELARRIARALGVEAQFNLQAGWGLGQDPVDWGLRPESCDLLVGGILLERETTQLLTPLPYQESRWGLLGEGPRVGLLAPFWGADRLVLTEWLEARGYRAAYLDDAHEGGLALRRGEVTGVLTLEALRPVLPPLPWQPIRQLGAAQLAVGVWKGRTTLKRAVASALAQPAQKALPAAPEDPR